jgi:hypothetical protein
MVNMTDDYLLCRMEFAEDVEQYHTINSPRNPHDYAIMGRYLISRVYLKKCCFDSIDGGWTRMHG